MGKRVDDYHYGTVVGTKAGDTYYFHYDHDTITGSSGNDFIKLEGEYYSIESYAGNDNISSNGSLKGSIIKAGAGNDKINLSSYKSNDLYGEAGNDNITGVGYLDGGAGNDVIVAKASSVIMGGTGNDTITTSGCHSHSSIKYNSGDGTDIVAGFFNNDTLYVNTSASAKASKPNVIFNIGSGSVTYKSADHKFINVSDSSGLNTYLLSGTTLFKANTNFSSGGSLTDSLNNTFIYNGGSYANVYSNNGTKNDFIYNDDFAKYSTINGEAGNDTITDHSATSMIKYTPNQGNDVITFHDTQEVLYENAFDDDMDTRTEGYYRDNITHYYGGGLLAIDGTISKETRSSGGAVFTIAGGGKVNVNSSCFTVREIDASKASGYRYTRYWNGNKFNSLVYRGDAHESTSNTTDNSKGGTYDDPNSAKYYKENDKVENTSGADYIYTNYGINKTIDGAGGNDYIYNYGATESTIMGGDGNDTIYNVHNGHHAGHDYNEGTKDYTDYTKNVTIDGGTGNDYIYNVSSQVSIVGGTGNDTIFNTLTGGSDVTINGDDGNDLIKSDGARNTISGGQGKDTIYNYSSTGPASIDGGTEDDYIYNNSYQSTITGGTGKDTILNNSWTGPASIDGGTENDYIYNNSSQSTITGGDGNDTIYNMSSSGRASIDGGAGTNFIYNNSSESTITGGSSKDTIYNMSYYGRASIDAGADNDYIFNRSYHTTIAAGQGNDTIIDSTANSMVDYLPGDGNDVITFAKTTDYRGYDNVTHYYGGGLFAINSDSVKHSNYSYANTSKALTISPAKYTVYGQNAFSLSSDYFSVAGVNTFKVGSDTITVNTNCFTIREGTETDNYKYTRYWARNWSGSAISAKKFNSFVYLNDVHNNDNNTVIGTYDDPHSADKYRDNSINSFTTGDDYIYTNFGEDKLIEALDGDDYITNYGATKSTILGGSGKDSIYNRDGSSLSHTCLTGANTSYVTIDGGDGDDYIYNESTNVSISGSEGNDSVLNYGATVTVDGGTGNDSIDNRGSYSSIVGGDGKDSIYNYGSYATIHGDDASGDTVKGVEYDDYIYNGGAYASIFSGYGDDTIYSYGANVSINSGEGNDSIRNVSSAGPAYIDGDSGDNYIDNYASRSTILAGDGKDTIYNRSGSGPASIIADGGDNYITNESSSSTIKTGSGNDTIYNNSTLSADGTRIDAGDGNNYIRNKSGKSTILSGDGNDTIVNSSATGPATIKSTGGDNHITNSSSNSNITTGAGKDTIYNKSTSESVSIDSGDGDDYIENKSSKATILSGGGNDTIYHLAATGSGSIDAGAGDDVVFVQNADHLTLYGGTGDDVVSIGSTNYNNKVVFTPGDGNDVIYGWKKVNDGDYTILGGANYETYAVGKDSRDLLVSLEGDKGTIKFVNVLDPVPPFDSLVAVTVGNGTIDTKKVYDLDTETVTFGKAGYRVTLVSASDKDSVNSSISSSDSDSISSSDYFITLDENGETITLGTYDDSLYWGSDTFTVGIGTVVGSGMMSTGTTEIKTVTNKAGVTINLQESLYTENLKENIPTVSRTTNIKIKGNKANNFIIGGKGNDSINGGEGDDTLEGGAGNDTLTGGHLPIGNNSAITGEGEDTDTFVVRAYYPTVPAYSNTKSHKNATTITDFREWDILKIAGGHIATGSIGAKKNLQFTVANTGTNLNKATVNILEGAGKKITIINEDDTFSRQVYGDKSITVGADDGQTINTMWNPSVVTVDSSQRITPVGLIGNNNANLILSGSGDNTISGGAGNDIFVYHDGNDVILDYNDNSNKENDIIRLQGDQAIDSVTYVQNGNISSYKDAIYSMSNGGSIRINKAITSKKKSIKFAHGSGYTLQGSGTDLTLTITDAYFKNKYPGEKGSITETLKSSEMSAAVNNFNASSVSNKYHLEITSNGTIKGGKGNDTLIGGSDDDLFTGGAGNDVFVYSAGNDTITDYAAGEMIKLSYGQSITSTTLKGSNVILTVSDIGSDTVGTIQINGGKNKKITVSEETLNYGNGVATLTTTESQDISNRDFITTVDATKATTAIKLTGNDQHNILKGGNGDDTLRGGVGDDTLTGGKGNDTFIYDKGDDVITDYAVGDKIIMPDYESYSVSVKGNDVTFVVDDGTLRVVKGKGKFIDINGVSQKYTKNETITKTDSDSNVETDTNTSAYIVSAQNAVTDTWFTVDDNFATNDVSSLIQESTTVTDNNVLDQITNYDANDILTNDNQSEVITYNQDKNK